VVFQATKQPLKLDQEHRKQAEDIYPQLFLGILLEQQQVLFDFAFVA